jgi:hypothetical protein
MKNLLTGAIPASICNVVSSLDLCYLSYATLGSDGNDFDCPRHAGCKTFLESTPGATGCGLGASTCSTDPVDCVGSWSAWGCTVTCGGGSNRRTFSVSQAAYNGGAACSASAGATEQKAGSCNTASCVAATTSSTHSTTRSSAPSSSSSSSTARDASPSSPSASPVTTAATVDDVSAAALFARLDVVALLIGAAAGLLGWRRD